MILGCLDRPVEVSHKVVEHLPHGTVAFLFTDIEGSTRLWEESASTMSPTLIRHDEILKRTIEKASGTVFKTVGDSFCAAFPTVSEAVEAALEAQLALLGEQWPDEAVLRVRMALHAGAVESRNGDYFGLTLNRISRVLALSHGSQILLTGVAYDLCRDQLPKDTGALSLGEHRLRDLLRPESLFQLTHPGLPSQFPELRSLDHIERHNLPLQLTTFIGREKEIEDVGKRLAESRLVTLTGAGGCGKTRLALQTAVDLLDSFRDGVWFIDQAPISDPFSIASAIAQALQLRTDPSSDSRLGLLQALSRKEVLLILDNCEHLLPECALLAESMLKQHPGIRILATSREPLMIPGEQVCRVGSLSLPERGEPLDAAVLKTYDAVRLFVDRAVAAREAFTVTNENAPALAAVCQRLDGIPLAIELAAARLRSLTIQDLDKRLDDCFRILTGGNRLALPRQQTLRALIDWSYNLLNTPEKALLARLSVFRDGWDLAAAEAIGSSGSVEDGEVLDLLTSLADKSLVIYSDASDAGRYRMLETIRQYSHERLKELGETEQTQERHVQYFHDLAIRAGEDLEGPDQAAASSLIQREEANLRAAMNHAEARRAFSMIRAIGSYWYRVGQYRQGREVLESILSKEYGPEDSLLYIRALHRLTAYMLTIPDYQALLSNLTRLYEEHPDSEPGDIAGCLAELAMSARWVEDIPAARDYFQRAQALYEEIGDKTGALRAIVNNATTEANYGEEALAIELLTKAEASARELSHRHAVAYVLNNRAYVDLCHGRIEEARRRFLTSINYAEQHGIDSVARHAKSHLAQLDVWEGALERACGALEEELDSCVATGNLLTGMSVRDVIADMAVALRRFKEGAVLLGASAVIHKDVEVITPLDNLWYGPITEELRSNLSDEEFDQAWGAGGQMSFEEAAVEAKLLLSETSAKYPANYRHFRF